MWDTLSEGRGSGEISQGYEGRGYRFLWLNDARVCVCVCVIVGSSALKH